MIQQICLNTRLRLLGGRISLLAETGSQGLEAVGLHSNTAALAHNDAKRFYCHSTLNELLSLSSKH